MNDMLSIKLIRLLSGEELLAKVSSEGIGTLKLTKPFMLFQDPRNPSKVSIIPWPQFSDGIQDAIEIQTAATVYYDVNAPKALADLYIQATSGILPAKTMPPKLLID